MVSIYWHSNNAVMQPALGRSVKIAQMNILKIIEEKGISKYCEKIFGEENGHKGIITVILLEIGFYMINRWQEIKFESFYGIAEKYFNLNEIIAGSKNSLFIIIFMTVLLMIGAYLTDETTNKCGILKGCYITSCICYIEAICINEFIGLIGIKWLPKFISANIFMAIIIAICVVNGIYIGSLLRLRKETKSDKKRLLIINNVTKGLSMISFLIIVSATVLGAIFYNVSNKKMYEIVEQNRAIITEYNGKWVTMDCEVEGENLILKKGTYRLEEMTDKVITYREYQKVTCKEPVEKK